MKGRVHVSASMLDQMPAIHLEAVWNKAVEGFDFQILCAEVGREIFGSNELSTGAGLAVTVGNPHITLQGFVKTTDDESAARMYIEKHIC